MKPVLKYELHGYAIASDDDIIADLRDEIPDALKYPADQKYFQEELNKAQLVVMGSIAHRMFPNMSSRSRLVLTSKSDGLMLEENVYFLNPEKLTLKEALQKILPHGGRVAVPGGAHVIEACWVLGFACFHLTRVKGLRLIEGKKLFRDCTDHRSADDILRAHGLILKEERSLGAPLTLCLYE